MSHIVHARVCMCKLWERALIGCQAAIARAGGIEALVALICDGLLGDDTPEGTAAAAYALATIASVPHEWLELPPADEHASSIM